MSKNKYPLPVERPRSFSYVKRNIPEVTVEQREKALKEIGRASCRERVYAPV